MDFKKIVLILCLLVLGITSTFSSTDNPYESKAMRTIWGFSHRQLDGKGWCKLSDVTPLFTQNLATARKATGTERIDIIKALARVVRLADADALKKLMSDTITLRDALATSNSHKKHYARLAMIYDLLTKKKNGEVLDPADPWIKIVNEAVSNDELNLASVGSPPKSFRLRPIDVVAKGLDEKMDSEFDLYSVARGLSHPRYKASAAKKTYATLRAYAVGGYKDSLGDIICINVVSPAKHWDWDQKPTSSFALKAGEKTIVSFPNKTTQELIVECANKGHKKVGAVSYANGLVIGGGALVLWGSQEEALVREILGLYESLNATGSYPIPGGRDAYNEPLIDLDQRSHEGLGFTPKTVHAGHYTSGAFLLGANGVPVPANIITVAAYDLRTGYGNDAGIMGPSAPKALSLGDGTKKRIRAMFDMAIDDGISTIITGLFGCGAFSNDPKSMAGWFVEVLNEPEYQGKFEEIIFSTYRAGDDLFKDTVSKGLSTLYFAAVS